KTALMPDTHRSYLKQMFAHSSWPKVASRSPDSWLVDEPLPSFPGPFAAPGSSEGFRSCSFAPARTDLFGNADRRHKRERVRRLMEHAFRGYKCGPGNGRQGGGDGESR